MIDMDLLNSTPLAQGSVPCHAGPLGLAGASGVLVIDKPPGLTSFNVVSRLKKWLRSKKVGHCGTLDPFATGVLVVCLNQATRVVDQLLNHDKTYRFEVCLGVETDTLDRTGEILASHEGPACSKEDLQGALSGLLGTYLQQVPRYAAVKIQGMRLYEWSRKGIDVDRPLREIRVSRLEVLRYTWPYALLEAHCSKGTYIRQLSADLGRLLGCGAHVKELQRIASGPFRLENALSLDACREMLEQQSLESRIIPMSDALGHLPALPLEDEGLLKRLCDGQLDPAWEDEHRKDLVLQEGPVRLLAGNSHLVALWWPRQAVAEQRRLRVFRPCIDHWLRTCGQQKQ